MKDIPKVDIYIFHVFYYSFFDTIKTIDAVKSAPIKTILQPVGRS